MFLFSRSFIKPFICYSRLYSSAKRCPYDVLRLRKNCTDKEIKEAFIKMSKEYHPDKNKDAKAQERFVNIVEAYNVLGKPSSRAQYDIMSHTNQTSYVYKTHTPWNLRNNPHYHYQYQETHSTQQPKQEKSYYGVAGIKKLPNYMIIMICFGFAFVGLCIQLFVIRQSFRVHRETINEKSRAAAEELDRVRAAARDNGNEQQLVLAESSQDTDSLDSGSLDLDTDSPSAPASESTEHRLLVPGEKLFRVPDILQVEEPQTGLSVLEAVIQPGDEAELQTRLMLEKIVSGAKPAIATASLGQSLANEKKETPSDRVLTEYGLSSEDVSGDWYTSSFRSSIKGNPLGLAFEIETWFE